MKKFTTGFPLDLLKIAVGQRFLISLLLFSVFGIIKSRPLTTHHPFPHQEFFDPLESGNATLLKRNENRFGPVATLDFLKRFGYLESSTSSSDSSSETLFSEKSIIEAIKEMQRFGSIEQTGLMDNETLKLLTKPRCGVEDKIHKSRSRNRRYAIGYAIGSRGWNKKEITYSIENWSTKMDLQDIKRELKKAFSIWSPYSHLKFIPSSYSTVGDISISFGRGSHGDSYPFDGTGGILGHAYFPYDSDYLGGDIHFDDDEQWGIDSNDPSRLQKRESSREPLDSESEENSYTNYNQNSISFLDVATHEIGHSLGLAHSPEQDSIMFPYYQKRSEEGLRLGYDDILALYQLYIQQRPFGPEIPEIDHVDEEEEVVPGEGESSDEHEHDYENNPEISSTSETPVSTTTATDTTTTSTTTISTTDRKTLMTTTTSATTKEDIDPDPEEKKPNLCSTTFDSLAFIRNELFVFAGRYMWRLGDRRDPALGYPYEISRFFPALSRGDAAPTGDLRVDAAYERNDGKIIFFTGNKYWTFDGTESIEPNPRPLQNLGFSETPDKLDAAFTWGRNGLTYFFRANQYWRYNETRGEMDEGYPQDISKWGGISGPLQSVLRWRDDQTYFFKDGYYLRLDDYSVTVDETGRISDYWFNC